MGKKIELIIIIFFLYSFSTAAFSAVTDDNANKNDNINKIRTSNKQLTNKKTKKHKAQMNFDYLHVGMNFMGTSQNVFATPPNFDNDVKFFGYELVVDFQYLFKDVLLNINFEYSDFKTTMHYSNTSTGNYSIEANWEKKVLSFSLGYTYQFNNKYVLVFPVMGFGYQDHKNPGTYTKHRTEIYYLIFGARLFIKISDFFEIGTDLNFRLLLSHVASYKHQTNGQGESILRKGIFFNFNIPMHFNLSKIFFISLTPWVTFFHHPESDAYHVNTDTGNKVSVTYHETHLISGGGKLLFGVYF